MSSIDSSTVHAGEAVAELVRPLGAVERLTYRYGERSPVHFSIVAEFDVVLDAREVHAALVEVQKRHPLLSVHITDDPATRLGFYRAPSTAFIPLQVRDDSPWQSCAAEGLAHPFDRSTAPLMRAVLVVNSSRSAVVLTFDHTIADGISSVMILRDLLTALNEGKLDGLETPPSQETMLDRAFTANTGPAAVAQPQPDPRVHAPTSTRAFDGTAPHLHTVAMDATWTARLVARCRAENTTVHAAIVTAACRIRSQQLNMDYVRALNPINFRSLINVDGDCADYFCLTVTSMAPHDGLPFWEQVRATGAQLTVARSAPGFSRRLQPFGKPSA